MPIPAAAENVSRAIDKENVPEANSRLAKHLRMLGFVLLLALLLVPVWEVDRPPLCDYPNHLARNFVLSHLGDKDHVLDAYYRANWGLYPYLAMDGIMQGLNKALPVDDAGRVLVSLSVLAFPLALWLWLRVSAPESTWLVWLSPLICFDRFYRQGFVNYQLALGVAFFLFSIWWPLRLRPAGWRLGCVCALAVLLYCTHLIVFFIALYALCAEAICRRDWRQMLLPFAMGAGGIGFYAVNRHAVHGEAEQIIWSSLSDKFTNFPSFFYFEASLWAKILGILVGSCLIAGVVLPWRRPRRDMGAIALLLGIAYLLLPYQFSETAQVDLRLLPFIAIFAAVAVASKAEFLPKPSLVAMAIIWSMVSVLDTSSFALHTARAEHQLDSAISLIPEGARVLPIMGPKNELYGGDTGMSWYLHYVDYAVIERRAFVPTLFDFPGQTELRLRPAYFAKDWFHADWNRVRCDYDFVWAYDADALKYDLDQVGDPVYINRDLTLYRLRSHF